MFACYLLQYHTGVHAGQPSAAAMGHNVWWAVPHQRCGAHAAATAGGGCTTWLGEWQELHGCCGAAGAVPAVPAETYARGKLCRFLHHLWDVQLKHTVLHL
jgi:hypothetical protein